MHHHFIADGERATVAVAHLAAKCAAALVFGIFTCPGYYRAAIDLDIGTIGILTATDAGAPAIATAIDGSAIDDQRAAIFITIELLTATDTCSIGTA